MLEDIQASIVSLTGKASTIMATTAEALAVIGQINTATTAIGVKLTELANRPDVSPEVSAALNLAAADLTAMASGAPAVPVDPGVIPGTEPLPE